jgi:hypothetical protein
MGLDVSLQELRHVTRHLTTKLAPLLKFTEEAESAIRVLCQHEAHFARHDQIIAATARLLDTLQDKDPDGIHNRVICRLGKNGLSTL